MARKKNKQRRFSGMSYREVQRSNSHRRSKLPKLDQQWLKENGYKNVGWDNVIKLYHKIDDFLSASDSDELSLEELFLKADQVGNQYQTPDEIKAFNQALSSEVEAISDEIDKQFTETAFEFVDYSQSPRPVRNRKPSRRRKQ